MIKKGKTKNGLGLVEAIIAIFIVGIVAVSFMGLATQSLLEYYRIEQYDSVTNENIYMGEQFRKFVNYRNNPDNPPIMMTDLESYKGNCFSVADDAGKIFLEYKCQIGNVAGCQEQFKDSLTYAVACVEPQAYNENDQILKVLIVSGLSKCGTSTGAKGGQGMDCLVSEQKNYVLYKLYIQD